LRFISIKIWAAATAAITLLLTFSVTSFVIPSTSMARYANAAAAVLSAVAVLLDIFQPFERLVNPYPSLSWALTILLLLAYGALLLRQYRSYSLRVKLIIAFLAASLIPLAALAFINDRNTRVILDEEGNLALRAAAQQVAVRLDTFMTDNLNFNRTQAISPPVSANLSVPPRQRVEKNDEMTAVLSSFARHNPIFIDSVAVIDLNGITLLDTFTGDIGVDKSSRSYFKKPLESGLPYVSDLEFSQTTGAASIYFSAPVRSASGEIVGVLRARYNAAVLQEIVSANNGLLGEGSFAVLLDSQRNVRLAHGLLPALIFKSVVPMDSATLSDLQSRRLMPPGSAEELSTNLPQFEAALKNAKTQPFFVGQLATGLERGAIVNMQTQEWAVVYAQPQDLFLQPINRQVRANLIVALIAAIAVAGVAVFISSTLAGPILRLTQTAEVIGAGNLNVQAKVESSDEIGVLALTLNRMTQQLREFIASLEERVAERTKDLATVAEVATVTSTILDTHKLLQEVVDLTKERFNLYHSHIYLLDEKGENLVLTAGAGEPGRIMAAEKRSIPLSREQSLVARAARERKGVIVNDVTQAPDFLPNPLLPNTRSEMAVPMLVGDTLIGVFDIQSDQTGRFTDSDVNIQTTLAAQIAASVQNARSYERSKEQAEFEALVNAIGDRIQRATTLEDTLQTAIREVAVALGATRVSASLQASYQSEITGEN
jgi:putative methionine-R-sulfoxide reductase with GAF domain